MEVIVMAAVLGVLFNMLQRGTSPYRPGICMWCPEIVHWNGRDWVHANGRQYAPLGHTSAMHPACPDRSEAIA